MGPQARMGLTSAAKKGADDCQLSFWDILPDSHGKDFNIVSLYRHHSETTS